MDKSVATFEAKCGKCRRLFEHPSFGDFAYGKIMLSTIDGRHNAWVDAFSEFPSRITPLDPTRAETLGETLAFLADEIDGQKLVANIVCPNCGSDHIEYWNGKRIGVTLVEEATFLNAQNLDGAPLQSLFDQNRTL